MAGERYDPRGRRVPTERQCGTMTVHRRLLQRKDYSQARARIETRALESRRDARLRTAAAQVITIPIVVHVVHNTPEQNVSMAQIESQIDALNRDYRMANADRSTVPAVFAPLVADAKLQFALATIDPSGNATNGMTRTATSTVSFTDDDSMKLASTGGADPWPADRYLNLWVCDLGDLLGYATFPGAPPNLDGVVVHYGAFGTMGTAQAPFDLGRTATHEIGHWLNLYHIWGDDGLGCAGSDQVDDTPNQGGPNRGRPAYPKLSCENGPNGDLFVNYMDYVDDATMVMFTTGQVARMREALEGPRASILAASPSNATQAPVTPAAGSIPARDGQVIASGVDRLEVFVVGANRGLYRMWWDGVTWRPSSGAEYLGRKLMDRPVIIARKPDAVDVFVLGTNHGLHHKGFNGSAWSPAGGFTPLGGEFRDAPAAVAPDATRLELFAIGTDAAVYQKAWTGTAWQPANGFDRLDGVMGRYVDAVSRGPNRIDVFVVAIEGGLYRKSWNGSGWTPAGASWEPVGAGCNSRPKVVSPGGDRLDVFVVNGRSMLCHKFWDGAAWQPSANGWFELFGPVVGDPEAIATAADRIDVFAVGADSVMRHKWWNGAAWLPAGAETESLGGVCTSAPRAASWSPGRVDLFVRNADSELDHKFWNGTSWQPSNTAWDTINVLAVEF